MDKQKYLEDLQEIRSIMDRSSRFISLSGLSGIAAGAIGLLGTFWAYAAYYSKLYPADQLISISKTPSSFTLPGIALVTLVTALGAVIFFTRRKAQKNKQTLWDAQAKRLLINLLIPLVAGGLLCLILFFKGMIALLAPFTLVFYGLGLVNASKYTLSEIRSLGLLEVALGLFACQFPEYGLIFWAVGFGVLHIIYGMAMHLKYGA